MHRMGDRHTCKNCLTFQDYKKKQKGQGDDETLFTFILIKTNKRGGFVRLCLMSLSCFSLIFAALCRSAARQRCLEGTVQESAQLHIGVWGLGAVQATCGSSELSSMLSRHTTGHAMSRCCFQLCVEVPLFCACPGLPQHHWHTHGLWHGEKDPGGRSLWKPHRAVQRHTLNICQC